MPTIARESSIKVLERFGTRVIVSMNNRVFEKYFPEELVEFRALEEYEITPELRRLAEETRKMKPEDFVNL